MPTFSEPPSIDTTAPTVSDLNPADESFGVGVGVSIGVTFSEAVQRGTGNIVLKTTAGTTVATFDAATSGNLSISGAILTINPTTDLGYSTGYIVEFTAGSIRDFAGNNYAGAADYNFSTLAASVNQTFVGTSANESFISGTGSATIDGGTGIDAVIFNSGRSSFALAKTPTGFSLTDKTDTARTDTLQNIERLKFSDGNIALDVAATQSAGGTALLLGAVLPGKLVFDSSKQALLGAVISLFDQGYTLRDLSGAVMRLPIWDILTGKATPTNTDIASYLLTNVNGAAPGTTTLTDAVAALDAEFDTAHGQGAFLSHLADSATNQLHVGLTGLADTGLQYI